MSKVKEIKIGHVIRAYRKLEDLTQERLAEKLHISFQQLQKYEYDKSTTPLKMLYKLCRELDIPPLKFFEDLNVKDSIEHLEKDIEEHHEIINLIKNNPKLIELYK